MISPVSAGGGFTRTGICTIVDMKSLEIEVDVNESYINRVTPGADGEATLDAYPDWQIPAHVITPMPTADRQKATVKVRIAFEQLDPRILPDMGVKVAFLRRGAEPDAGAAPRRKPAVVVPRAAVRKRRRPRRGLRGPAGDRVERRAVERSARHAATRSTVISGLAAGERVVIEGPADLQGRRGRSRSSN